MFRCPKTGCVGAARPFLRDETQIGFATADSDYLYWSSSFDIYRCRLSGCGDVPEVVAKNQVADAPLRLQGDYLYWSSSAYDPSTGQQTPEQIFRASKDGSSPPTTLVATSLQATKSFTVFRDQLYFLDSRSHVRSCAVTGCG
ncbi:MAG TPA: hypothetical protein VHW01_00080, partial [Polyangiaceae bacterium]|nr:hypothetical protein [Polyangiaceae bacterium]